jgi:hypothetical protein
MLCYMIVIRDCVFDKNQTVAQQTLTATSSTLLACSKHTGHKSTQCHLNLKRTPPFLIFHSLHDPSPTFSLHFLLFKTTYAPGLMSTRPVQYRGSWTMAHIIVSGERRCCKCQNYPPEDKVT